MEIMVHEYIIAIKAYNSEALLSFSGERYSDHSFCFLSSLFKNEVENVDFYSSTTRAISIIYFVQKNH